MSNNGNYIFWKKSCCFSQAKGADLESYFFHFLLLIRKTHQNDQLEKISRSPSAILTFVGKVWRFFSIDLSCSHLGERRQAELVARQSLRQAESETRHIWPEGLDLLGTQTGTVDWKHRAGSKLGLTAE